VGIGVMHITDKSNGYGIITGCIEKAKRAKDNNQEDRMEIKRF